VRAAIGIQRRPKTLYTMSKQTVVIWTMVSAVTLIKRGIRMNCILPGPTSTPFMEQQSTITPDSAIDAFTQPINRRSTPEEQGGPLVFLNSAAASYINGAAIPVDGGFMGGVATGEIDLIKPIRYRSGDKLISNLVANLGRDENFLAKSVVYSITWNEESTWISTRPACRLFSNGRYVAA